MDCNSRHYNWVPVFRASEEIGKVNRANKYSHLAAKKKRVGSRVKQDLKKLEDSGYKHQRTAEDWFHLAKGTNQAVWNTYKQI